MAKKTYLDFSLFDEIGDAMDLFGNLIRNCNNTASPNGCKSDCCIFAEK